MRRTGFTLIELLVVIAIIAILAAILFPVFARARAKAMQNNCLSNVKQIALGFIMYAADNDDMIPHHTVTGGQFPSRIYPYVKNVQIFLCPSDSVASGSVGTWLVPGTTTPNNGCSYAQGYAFHPWYNMNSMTQTTCPAERLLIADARGGWTALYGWSSGGAANYINTSHNEGANIGFWDGHAKFMAQKSVPNWISGDATYSLCVEPACRFWGGKDAGLLCGGW